MNKKIELVLISSLWLFGSIIIVPLFRSIYQAQIIAFDTSGMFAFALALCAIMFWVFPPTMIYLHYSGFLDKIETQSDGVH